MAYKTSSKAGMFEQEFTLDALAELGNPLPRLKEVLDFEQFRPILESALKNENRKAMWEERVLIRCL